MSVLTTTKWAIDASHSTAAFKVRHLGVANVTGTFKVFQGEIEHEGDAPEMAGALEASDFDGAKVRITVDTTSLDTMRRKVQSQCEHPHSKTLVLKSALRPAKSCLGSLHI